MQVYLICTPGAFDLYGCCADTIPLPEIFLMSHFLLNLGRSLKNHAIGRKGQVEADRININFYELRISARREPSLSALKHN